jgi:hypothetical protein
VGTLDPELVEHRDDVAGERRVLYSAPGGASLPPVPSVSIATVR